MLAIRMKRTGRSGHAQFRVVVQDSHFHPSRGKVVAYLGSYDPHTKAAAIDKELAQKYLSNGAQPSDRVASILKAEGVKLPAWVKLSAPTKRAVRNPEKRRSTRPAEPKSPEAEEAPAEPAAEVTPTEKAADEAPGSEAPAEERATPDEEAPAATEESTEPKPE